MEGRESLLCLKTEKKVNWKISTVSTRSVENVDIFQDLLKGGKGNKRRKGFCPVCRGHLTLQRYWDIVQAGDSIAVLLSWVWLARIPWPAMSRPCLFTSCCHNLVKISCKSFPIQAYNQGSSVLLCGQSGSMLKWGEHEVPYDGASASIQVTWVAWHSFFCLARVWVGPTECFNLRAVHIWLCGEKGVLGKASGRVISGRN